MMRSRRVVPLVLGIALVVALAPVAVGMAQPKIPADFTFEQGKDAPGVVTFSHAFHVKENGKCNACHVKIFKMKRGADGPITMARMKSGQLCGACHNGKTEINGKTVFAVDDKANCEKCHKK